MSKVPIDPEECDCQGYWYSKEANSWMHPLPFHCVKSGALFCYECYTLRTADGRVIHLEPVKEENERKIGRFQASTEW